MMGAVRDTAGNAATLPGNTKVTRKDWFDAAVDTLLTHGIEHVKVLSLSGRLGVSRSSFYWYFTSRQNLLDCLLQHWLDTNTPGLVAQAGAPATSITGAVCNVFLCFFDDRLFNARLDFAVREWARRTVRIRKLFDRSDAERIAALRAMFARYGYGETDALIRARVLYYMQIGYNLAELNEPTQVRLSFVPQYLTTFTGRTPDPDEVLKLEEDVRAATRKD